MSARRRPGASKPAPQAQQPQGAKPARPAKRATRQAVGGGTRPGAVYQVEVVLRGVDPPVWRRLLVPGDTTLGRLHRVLQVAVGWQESHLHVFEAGGKRYSDPKFALDVEADMDVADEHAVTLARVTRNGEEALTYEYDFGDSWEHDVRVEKVFAPGEAPDAGPVCLAGERACPPEDVGGVPGYAEFLQAMADPDHEDHLHYLEWVGGEFAPEAFDLAAVNRALRRVR